MNKRLMRQFVIADMIFIIVRMIVDSFINNVRILELSFQVIDSVAFATVLILLNKYLNSFLTKKLPLLWIAICEAIGSFLIVYSNNMQIQGVLVYFICAFPMANVILYMISGFKLRGATKERNLRSLAVSFMILSIVNIMMILFFVLIMPLLYKVSSHTITENSLLVISCLVELYILFAIQRVFKERKKDSLDDELLDEEYQ